MRVIKGENQYAIVLSKDELRYVAACVGAGVNQEILERIKQHPRNYCADPIDRVSSLQIFHDLIEHIPNKVEGKCF